jgi:tetratricopeptide (TPR) repeat protein
MGLQLDDAEREHRQALAVRKKLANEFPGVAAYQRDMAGSLHNIAGIIVWQSGKQKEAVPLFEQAIHYQGLALEREPENATSRQFMHHHQNGLAWLLGQMGRLDEAADHYREATDIAEKLTKDFPSEPNCRDWLYHDLNGQGNILEGLGMWEEAERQYREALRVAEQSKTLFPKVAGLRSVAGARHNWAMVLDRTGKRAEALELFKQALSEEQQALKLDPHDDQARVFLQEHHRALGALLARLGRRSEAKDQFRQGLVAGEKAATETDDLQRRSQLTRSHASLGRLLSELGHWKEADTECRQALAEGDKLAAAAPTVQRYAIFRAVCDAAAADLLRDRGCLKEALADYARASTALDAILAKEPRLVEARDALRDAHAGRARALDRLGRHAQAVQYWEQAVKRDDGSQHAVLQLGLAISQAQVSGNHDQALSEAESLAKDSDAPTLEGLARLCALASAVAGERYAVQAVKLLGQAVSAGYRDTLYLKEGADLAPLRQRDDFKKLLAELEEKTKAPPAGKGK